MTKSVVFRKTAVRALRRHGNRANHIIEKIESYAADPASQANNVKALTGADALRLRVGDFRVLFTETETTITVLDVGPRGAIYE